MASPDPSFVAVSTDGHRFVFNALAARPEGRYEWDFGDPAAGTDNRAWGPEAVHRYAAEGVYTITLTADGADGRGALTARRSVTVAA